MPIRPEQLFAQDVLGDIVEMMQHRHSAPADTEGRMHVGLRPFHHLGQFVPIGDIFEIHMLDRCACDHQPIEFQRLHVGRIFVHHHHTFARQHVIGGQGRGQFNRHDIGISDRCQNG